MTLNRVGGLWDKIRKRVNQRKYHTELRGTGYTVLIMKKYKRKDKGRVTGKSLPHRVGFICSLEIKVGELYPAVRYVFKVDHKEPNTVLDIYTIQQQTL